MPGTAGADAVRIRRRGRHDSARGVRGRQRLSSRDRRARLHRKGFPDVGRDAARGLRVVRSDARRGGRITHRQEPAGRGRDRSRRASARQHAQCLPQVLRASRRSGFVSRRRRDAAGAAGARGRGRVEAAGRPSAGGARAFSVSPGTGEEAPQVLAIGCCSYRRIEAAH